MYIPGRRRTASSPSSTVIDFALYVDDPLAIPCKPFGKRDPSIVLLCSTSWGFRHSKLSADASNNRKLDLRVARDGHRLLVRGIKPQVMSGTVSHKLAIVNPQVLFQSPTLHELTNHPPLCRRSEGPSVTLTRSEVSVNFFLLPSLPSLVSTLVDFLLTELPSKAPTRPGPS